MATFTDTFNRADGALGADWTAKHGTSASIVSSQCVLGVAGDYAVYSDKSDYADVSVAFTFASGGSGVVLRSDGSNNNKGGNGYLFYCTPYAVVVQRVAAGVGTGLFSQSTTLATGATVKVTMVGTTITVYVNGTQVGTTTDATYASGYVGVCGAGNAAILDDFSVTDDLPLPSAPVRITCLHATRGDEPGLYAGTNDGRIILLDEGNNDGGVAIDDYYVIPPTQTGGLTQFRPAVDIGIQADTTQSVTMTPYTDAVSGQPVTLTVTPMSAIQKIRAPLSARGMALKLKLSGFGAGQPRTLSSVRVRYLPPRIR